MPAIKNLLDSLKDFADNVAEHLQDTELMNDDKR